MTEMMSLPPEPRRVKLRIEDYLLLDKFGAFAKYGRTELIEGEIVEVNAEHRPHARIKSRLHVAIAMALRSLGGDLEALVEGSVSMPPYNVPEPDISVTREPDGTGLIPLASIALVIEVADTTLRHDLGRKAAIYAREGVAEYWVVDVNARIIHQLWEPASGTYANLRELPFAAGIAAATIDGLQIDTSVL